MARTSPTKKTLSHLPPEAAQEALQKKLLAWYQHHQRRLPWRVPAGKRGKPDPYHVLVSEAMLQQTQVVTVIGYFGRFISAFPTVGDLAQASEQQVLRQWQGLGYYRRARLLHAAARMIVEDFGGQVPGDLESLRKLPGVGRYTAGAVASIAFGRSTPVVDGNVTRVLARALGLDMVVDAPAVEEHLWQLAGALVPRGKPGDYNQALMELGATVCTPTSPACLLCPWSELCEARRRGLENVLPRRRKRKPPRAVEHHILALQRGDLYLLERRPEQGLWSGLWQFPTVELDDDESTWTQVEALRQMHTRLHAVTAGVTKRGTFKHQTTHRTIRFVLWHAIADPAMDAQAANVNGDVDGDMEGNHQVWRRLSDLDDLPMSNPQRHAAELLNG